MLALQNKIYVHCIKTICSIRSNNCIRSFYCNKKIVVIHLTFIQRTKKLQVLCSYEKLQKPPLNVIPSEKHCSTCAIRQNKEMKNLPNTAQTRSAEQDAGVLKHEKEELMDTSSPLQDS